MYFLEFHLTFNFTMNTGRPRALAIKSSRRLNSGEWQKIWIDYNKHHVRFMINTDYDMVDLLPEEEFGPFEGSMFIGGATEYVTDFRIRFYKFAKYMFISEIKKIHKNL